MAQGKVRQAARQLREKLAEEDHECVQAIMILYDTKSFTRGEFEDLMVEVITNHSSRVSRLCKAS